MKKTIRKYLKRIIYLILGGSLVLFYHHLWILDDLIAPIYDLASGQKVINSKQNIDRVLLKFEKVPFSKLPFHIQDSFKEPKENDCVKQDFNAYYKKKHFYRIDYFNRYKYLVGKFRVKDFLTPDRLFKKDIHIPFSSSAIPLKNRFRIPHQDKTQYLFIDSKILYQLLDLSTKLKTKGLEPNFQISSGFRNPVYNGIVKGATCSRHQYGDAIDIYIGEDFNKDGKINKADREYIYDILETTIVKNTGGLGTYKNSTQVIHFDTRGHRARWNY